MSPLSILLVDDSDDDSYFFNHALERSRVDGTLLYASGGSEAIALLEQAQASNKLPDVIFVDLKMPVVNGFDVLAWIHERPAFSDIPIYVLSGSSSQKDVDRSRELGAAGFFIKPLGPDELRRSVQSRTGSQAGQGQGTA